MVRVRFMDSDPEHGGSGLAVAIGSGAVVSGARWCSRRSRLKSGIPI